MYKSLNIPSITIFLFRSVAFGSSPCAYLVYQLTFMFVSENTLKAVQIDLFVYHRLVLPFFSLAGRSVLSWPNKRKSTEAQIL